MENKTRWGVIGCGQIAVDKTLPAIFAAHNAELVAVADPLSERRALALATQPGATVREYADYHELLTDSRVDAVYISLPTGMHAEAVLAAVAARKPTLCEKPLGRHLPEVLEMTRAAKTAGVPLMTAYMSRFGSVYAEAARLVQSGAIGQVTFVHADFSYPALSPYPPGAPGGWRWTDAEGGGALLDIGIYLAFALREWLDDRVATVGAMQSDIIAPPGLPVRDTTAAWFRTERGVPGTFAATFTHAESRILLYGTRGRLDVQNCFSQSPTGLLSCESDSVRFAVQNDLTKPHRHFEHYLREIEHFSDSLQQGTPCRPTPEEVLSDTQFLQALKDSAATNAPVTIVPPAQLLENG